MQEAGFVLSFNLIQVKQVRTHYEISHFSVFVRHRLEILEPRIIYLLMQGHQELLFIICRGTVSAAFKLPMKLELGCIGPGIHEGPFG